MPSTRKIYFEFDNENPKVGDRIIRAFYDSKDCPIGEIRTIVEDNCPTNYHMKCDNGMGYNKIAEHGWRRLIKIGYE